MYSCQRHYIYNTGVFLNKKPQVAAMTMLVM